VGCWLVGEDSEENVEGERHTTRCTCTDAREEIRHSWLCCITNKGLESSLGNMKIMSLKPHNLYSSNTTLCRF
jgi:hypothetical protein